MMRETKAVFAFFLLGIFILSAQSYRSPFARYHAISSRSQESLKCSNIVNIETISTTSEAEMDRLLLENDDDDGDEEHDAESEIDELDINMIVDSDIDRSIQNAVQKLVDSGPKEPELSRVETFDNIYKVSYILRAQNCHDSLTCYSSSPLGTLHLMLLAALSSRLLCHYSFIRILCHHVGNCLTS